MTVTASAPAGAIQKFSAGPAALASLLSFSKGASDADVAPADRLLTSLGALPLHDDEAEDPKTLREKVNDLRNHGVAFSGSVVTADGRSIEIDGRVAGGQVALWITDPAVRMAGRRRDHRRLPRKNNGPARIARLAGTRADPGLAARCRSAPGLG